MSHFAMQCAPVSGAGGARPAGATADGAADGGRGARPGDACDGVDSGTFELEVVEIEGYDHNPRLFVNERREAIRGSLVANGFHDVMLVTRRPGQHRFMLAAGSNTTLSVLKEIWQETRDERFRRVRCLHQPFESEVRVMAQHLGENLNRGAMRFWEVATGMLELCRMLGEERLRADPLARPYSQRDLCALLAARGLASDIGRLSRWRFAVERLGALGPATQLLTERHVKVVQPRVAALRQLWAKFHRAEDLFWSQVLQPALEAMGQTAATSGLDFELDAERLCRDIEARFARVTGEEAAVVAKMLSLLRFAPMLTLAELKGQAQPADGDVPQSERGPSPRTQFPDEGFAASGQGRLFGAFEGSEGSNLARLHRAVRELLADCGLADVFVANDAMPLGFIVDMPNPAMHPAAMTDGQVSGGACRASQRFAWWQLAQLTGQWRPGCERFIDRSSLFYRAYRRELEVDPLRTTAVWRPAPSADDLLCERAGAAPSAAALQRLHAVELAAAAVYGQHPERWRRMRDLMQFDGGGLDDGA